jgi:DNA polymerase
MIIGQSPGVTEVERGMPFVGDSGALLDLMLEQAGVSREDVYIANALKCHPPTNRPANSTELKNCRRTWLKPEIQSIGPKVVLVLGKDAVTSLNLLDDWGHGNVVKKKRVTIIIAYHPAYFLRRGDEDSFIAIGDTVKEILGE